MCREADRFAAAALMQPEAFSLLAERSGLDVLVLQRTYRCSYASVTLRLAEVMGNRPLMTVLYEREEKGDPAGWAEPPALSATVVRRTRGFGNPTTFSICGQAGRRPPTGQAPLPRLPGGAGRPLRQHAVRTRGRVRRHSPARSLEGAAGEGRGRRRARRGSGRARPPTGASDVPGRRRQPVAVGGPW